MCHFELERTGNPIGSQKIKLELTKLNRIRRGLVREEPSVAQTFLASRAVENDMMRQQQRMLNDLNESQAQKKRANAELLALQNKVKTAKQSLRDLTALTEEEKSTLLATAEFLGKGVTKIRRR